MCGSSSMTSTFGFTAATPGIIGALVASLRTSPQQVRAEAEPDAGLHALHRLERVAKQERVGAGELRRVEVVVGRRAGGELLQLVDEPQPDEVLVGIGDLTELTGAVEPALGGGAQAVDRVGLRQTELERRHAGGADELQRAGALDVDRASLGPAAAHG